jgi:hypothetical protein
MRRNMGRTDRTIRFIGGVVVGAVAAAGLVTGVWAWAAWAVAAILVVTSIAGNCPAYTILGWSTTPKPASPA